ncbi:MAG: PilZ domain-containing protein [Terriglobales bacterium]
MDPNIFSEQLGSTDSSEDGDGANYLRRLKGGTAKTGVKGDAGAVAGKAAVDWKERRQSPRLRCSGSVEFRVDGGDVRLWGTLIDISLHGCYIEMSNTHAIDTHVHLVLNSCGYRIQTAGVVRASYPALGMGICFTEVEPAQQSQLRQLVEMLAGISAVSNGVQKRETATNESHPVVDPKALVDDVTEFFRKNPLLSREEFHRMAKRVQ